MNYHTMREAGYTHYATLGDGEHLLMDIETGALELWFCNKYHAGYGIKYKNTHLEFARSIRSSEEVGDVRRLSSVEHRRKAAEREGNSVGSTHDCAASQ